MLFTPRSTLQRAHFTSKSSLNLWARQRKRLDSWACFAAVITHFCKLSIVFPDFSGQAVSSLRSVDKKRNIYNARQWANQCEDHGVKKQGDSLGEWWKHETIFGANSWFLCSILFFLFQRKPIPHKNWLSLENPDTSYFSFFEYQASKIINYLLTKNIGHI